MGVRLDFPSYTEEALEEGSQKIRKSVLEKVKIAQIDFSDRAGLASRLNDLNRSIEEISAARKALGEFIKKTFPISEIID
jgi:hypothetical protein